VGPKYYRVRFNYYVLPLNFCIGLAALAVAAYVSEKLIRRKNPRV